MGEALRERSECIWSTVDSALEVWVEIGGELEEESWDSLKDKLYTFGID
jgi:hypothetical protein